ncbi:MAG: DnaJ domain-containing protein [Methylobacter sp.]
MVKDYFRILGLADTAEDVVIRAVFKLLAHRYHPDKQLEGKEQANRTMSEINEAYQRLSKPVFKARYGQALAQGMDCYQILGVQRHVDAQMVRTAYEALARKHKNAPYRLNGIEHAYAVLADAGKRKSYDNELQRLADTRKRMQQDLRHRNSTAVSNKKAYHFKRQPPAAYAHRRPGLSLWKVYLAYNLAFYLLMAALFLLI